MGKEGKGQRRVDDDVLSGFARTGERAGEFRGFFTTMLIASLYVWDVMFDLGAYNTVLFYREDAYLVLSTVALVGVVAVRSQVQERWWVLAAFAPPALLLVYRLATPVKHPGGWLGAIGYVVAIMNMATLPLLVWLIGRMLAPEYFAVQGRRLRITLAVTLVGVAIAGFLAGHYNHRYLTCDDFAVAGHGRPENCRDTSHHG